MMTVVAHRSRPGNGIRRHLLWLLAALLAAATVHAIMRVIHDTSRRRIAAGLVAQSMAEQLMVGARHRLELGGSMGLETPGIDAGGEAASRLPVEALMRRHREIEACRCVSMPPALGYFRAGTGKVDVAMAPGWAAAFPDARRGALLGIGGSGDTIQPTGIRLALDLALEPLAAVTAVERDFSGHPTGVVGLLANRDTLLRWLFDPDSIGVHSARPSSTLAELDSRSVEVRGPSGAILFGAADPARRFRATVADSITLGGAAITVALETHQIASPLIAPIASAQVWHLAAMLLGTIVVVIVALRSARREAQLASARSDFVAAVSHELRMPLAQILLASETLAMQRERDAAQRLGLASSILREARRLIALVENVLLFSRTGAVALRPKLEAVAVDELFADVREAVELAIEDAGDILDTSAPAGLVVRGDRTLIRQALVNLLDNAMKYGGTGQRIRLIGRQAADAVQLLVEDEGRGVPHTERRRVFAPWERLARDQSSERTGTGLGLAVVREVAAACGGRVWLEETGTGGARAVLELPAATPAPRDPASAIA